VSATPLEIARAFYRALAAVDADALFALTPDDFEWVTVHTGTKHGHDALSGWVERQSFGVAMHVEPKRFFARGDVVVVQTRTELRYVDDPGELADTTHGAAVLTIRGERVARWVVKDDLESALEVAGLSEADEVGRVMPP
jgi:ketosteroid isomerase-like protein